MGAAAQKVKDIQRPCPKHTSYQASHGPVASQLDPTALELVF